MRFATILPRSSAKPAPVVAAADGTWIELSALLGHSAPPLERLLASWMLQPNALAQRIARFSGARHREGDLSFLPPIPRPAAFRDFYAFEQHVKTARSRRGLEVPPAWYELPVFYFSNHN